MDSNQQFRFIGVNLNEPPPASQGVPRLGRLSFAEEIQSMLFAFGDSRLPRFETASLVEEICQQQMAEIITRCSEIAQNRGSTSIGIEDVLFLMRKNPIKIQRLVQYLSIMEVAVSVKGEELSTFDPSTKRLKRCRDFLNSIDTDDYGPLSKAANQQLYDTSRMERLQRLDQLSRDLDERRYAEFTRARQVSFLGHKMKMSQKFYDWMVQDNRSDVELLPVDRSGLEALGYLAYETVGQIVDMSLQIRQDESHADPVLRQMAPLVYNSMYQPQVSDHSATTSGGLSDDKRGSDWMKAIEPKHINEALRRMTQRPTPMGWLSKSPKSKLVPLIAI